MPIKRKQGPCLNKKKKRNIVEIKFDNADTDVNTADVESCGEDSDDMEEISGELIYLSSQPWKQNKNVPNVES